MLITLSASGNVDSRSRESALHWKGALSIRRPAELFTHTPCKIIVSRAMFPAKCSSLFVEIQLLGACGKAQAGLVSIGRSLRGKRSKELVVVPL